VYWPTNWPNYIYLPVIHSIPLRRVHQVQCSVHVEPAPVVGAGKQRRSVRAVALWQRGWPSVPNMRDMRIWWGFSWIEWDWNGNLMGFSGKWMGFLLGFHGICWNYLKFIYIMGIVHGCFLWLFMDLMGFFLWEANEISLDLMECNRISWSYAQPTSTTAVIQVMTWII